MLMKRLNKDSLKSFFFGNRTSYGLVFTALLYMLLIAIGFVYLYPLLFMFITSMKSPDDLLNPMVQWVPTEFYTGNYTKAFRVLDYPTALVSTIFISLVPSLIQTAVCSVVGRVSATQRQRAVDSALEALSRGLGGRHHRNPAARLPGAPMITTHPLGGCAMGDVVDASHRVLGEGGEPAPNLYVCDGSVFRGALGTNPLWTIGALAERCAEQVLEAHPRLGRRRAPS